MGNKRRGNKNVNVVQTLAVPSHKMGGRGSIRDPKESDTSDLESLSILSTAGDSDILDAEDDVDQFVQINSLSGLVDEALDKRLDLRTKAIDLILSILSKYYVPEHLVALREALLEVIEKNLKRTPAEAMKMCTLATLIAIQLGVEAEKEILRLSEFLRTICTDASANEELRSASAQSLGLCVYLCVDQLDARCLSLRALRDIWSAFKPLAQNSTTLFTSVLNSWALLLERSERPVILSSIELQPKLCCFLESSTVECRISSGEALAILYEIASANIGDEFQFKNHDELELLLTDLAMDSVKFRAKRDKKLQRMTFRQINDTIFGGKIFSQEVQFNRREKLVLHGCHQKLLYDSLCQFLRGNMNRQLTSNEHMRRLFDLGPALEPEEMEDKTNLKAQKGEMMNEYGKQSKSRNIERSKFRARKQDYNRYSDCE